MVAATALSMGLAGYDGGATCGVATNAGGKGQPFIVKGMVRQEWGEMGEGGDEEECNKKRCNNDDNDNDDAAIAVAIAVANGAIEDYGLPCADNCLPKTSAAIEYGALPHAKNG
jgi:hypothetical protein